VDRATFEDNMRYKKIGQSFGLADPELESFLKYNRSLKALKKLNKGIVN